MTKSAMVRARTESKVKKTAEKILKKLGISTSEAINLFYNQIILKKGIPFKIEIPNEETIKTFNESDNNININSVNSLDDLYKELEI